MFAAACVCSIVAQAQAAEGEQPANLPPEGSPPLLRNVELKFGSENGTSALYDTYLYYMEIVKNISLPSQEKWVPYSEETEKILRGDFYRLWGTKFLDDLKIEVVDDDPWPNGVEAKRAIFTMVERPRVRIVTFEGSTAVKRTDIDTAMKDMDVEIRLDSFLDLQKVNRVEGLVSSMFSASGYQFAEITHEVEPVEAVANAVRLTFHMQEGPKVHVQVIDFVGNEKIDDSTLKSQMKQTKERWWLSWMTGRGTYKDALFEQDADLIVEHYLNEGYIDANVGSAETEYLDEAEDLQAVESLSQLSELAESDDRYAELAVSAARNLGMPRHQFLDLPLRKIRAMGWLVREATEAENGTEEDIVDGVNALARSERDDKLRLMRLRIPVDEGERYRVGEVRFDGHTVVTRFGIEAVFAGLRPGEYYSQAAVTQGLEAARELYGSIGYTDLTIFPDLQRRNEPVDDEEVDPEVDGEVEAAGIGEKDPGQYADLERPTHMDGDPIVDVTIRIEEGEQQYVNRITFTGHESTQDEVIRRELQLVENGVFSTVALKNSVLRLNQLGFFEPFEEDAVDIEAVEGRDNAVDLTVNLSEANLNQLTFGAGASQFDGFFGQVSFMTANFLGRGETLQVSLQNGSRLRDINLGYTKPYLFGRNISGGLNLFSRRIDWIGAFTQESNGGGITIGKPLALFTRFFVSYSLERTGVSNIDPFILDSGGDDNPFLSPFLADALLLGTGGRRTVSKVTPSLRFNTVDHPIFPTRGQSYTAAMEFAGAGGNTRFLKPTLEGIWYLRHTSRTLFGFRGQYQHIFSGRPETIPVFERLWLGGEYSLRGFDLRRVGPTIADVEPEVDSDSFQGRTLIGGNKSVLLNAEYQFSIAQPVRLVFFYDVGQVQDFGSAFTKDDFKTSTGVEFRFFMPMLNIPFRLIYAWNLQRDGVYNDRLVEQEASGFRFAVGTTF